jgi:YVTN family beta-propeller protein
MMQNDNSHGSCASVARGFAALGAVLAMWVGLLASPAEAAPLAYVANYNANTVSVIDTASNTVVGTIPVGNSPSGVAVAPDGKHAYVANYFGNSVSVIDTVANAVVATVVGLAAVGYGAAGVAVTPDGKHAYVTNAAANTVSVIDTATNTVVGTAIPVGTFPEGGSP